MIQPFTVDVLTAIENPYVSNNSFRIFTSYGNINIQTLSDEWDGQTGSVRILNIIGHPVADIHNTEFSKDSPVTFQSPATKGLYVVEIRSGGGGLWGRLW